MACFPLYFFGKKLKHLQKIFKNHIEKFKILLYNIVKWVKRLIAFLFNTLITKGV